MNMPGFTADASLYPNRERYQGEAAFERSDRETIMPQFRLGSVGDPDIGAYLRCRANGGDDLICRFFGGLPPFTIGGRLM